MGERIGYVRVSSVTQSTERQLDGIKLEHIYTDKLSGKDANRPELQRAMAYCRKGDTLVVHSLDRLGRNAEDLLRIVRELTAKGVTVEFVKNNMTFRPERSAPRSADMTGTLAEIADVIGMPGAKALCSMWGGRRLYVPAMPAPDCALVALLGELQAGRLAARYGGEGIEVPLPDLIAARRIEAKRLRAENFNISEIARELGVSRQTARRLVLD